MASSRLVEFSNRSRTEAEVRSSRPIYQRIACRMEKVGKVVMPDGGSIFQPLVRRPVQHNAMVTAEDFVRRLAAQVAEGPVVITELSLGDQPKRLTSFELRPIAVEPDLRPCDSERSE